MFRAATRKIGLIVGLVAITSSLPACSGGNDESTVAENQAAPVTTVAVPAEAPSSDELANAVFAGIEAEPVQLTDGLWEGEPFDDGGASRPTVGLVEDFQLAGDLTGDANQESVVLLWSNSGGSGTFNYVAVAGRGGDAVTNLGTAELGDRVQVLEGRIAAGKIELDVVQAGPQDAACCPTQMATRVWEMGPAGLTEGAAQITGTMTLAELLGSEWVLSDLARDEPAPAEPEVTLVFEADRIAGNAGCNGYFGSIEESAEIPSTVSIGPVGATRKMCPEEIMAVETRFIKQLGYVTGYGFLAGKLALSWQDDESGGAMLFTPRQPAS